MTFARTAACFACAAWLALSAPLVAEDSRSVRILPERPVAGEPFLVQVQTSTPGSPAGYLGTEVAVSGRDISLFTRAVDGSFSVPGSYRAAAVVIAPYPGSYDIDMQVQLSYAGGVTLLPRQNVASIEVGDAIGTAPPEFRGLDGIWWNPSEPGSALTVVENASGQLFLVWYTYIQASPGTPGIRVTSKWLVMSSGRWISSTTYRGILYDHLGPAPNMPFAPSTQKGIPYGLATLEVYGPDNIELGVVADAGVSPIVNVRKSLRRFAF